MRADLHVHTRCSPDSLLRPEDLPGLARRRRIDCLAITDHNSMAGVLPLAGREMSCRVIAGEEIQTREGELIGLFLRQEIPRGLGVRETIDLIHGQGGLAVLPHPCDRLRRRALAPALWEQVLPAVDLIEGFNGRTIFARDNQAAAALAARYGKPMTAGSDGHTRWELGRCGMEMDDFATPHDFLAALAGGNARFFGRAASPLVHLATKAVKVTRR